MTTTNLDELNEAIERLALEVRQQSLLLKKAKEALASYQDYDRLSIHGGIESLIRRAKLLDEVCRVLEVRTRNPDDAHKLLLRLDELVKKLSS